MTQHSVAMATLHRPQGELTPQMQGSQQPVVWLALIWFGLCASLVHKNNDLIGIFFAFVGSFGLAFLLSQVLFDKKNGLKSPNEYSRAKDVVGLMACILSSIFSGLGHSFHALTVATGYLAFDLWFSSVYCRKIPPPILAILQDALTLTFFLVALALDSEQIQAYQSWIRVWILYKACVFVRSLATRDSLQSTVVTIKPVLATNQSVAAVAASTVSRTNQWTVHGIDYDLTDFVKLHPGGKEALELGRGRDCTALFESYHPFTKRHRLVLQKYQIDAKQSPNKETVNDPFYDVLKQRVADTLIKQGIDPEKDRAAPPLRVAYYFLIAACLIVSACAHIQGSLVGSFLFAVFGWLIGALGHDAGHYAASRSAVVNDIGLWGMSLLCNPVMWQHQHTYAHHSYTNEYDHDPDLHHFDLLLRVHRRVQQQGYYKNQRYWPYVFFAYAFVVFGTCIWIPLDVMKTGFLYGMVEYTDRHRPLKSIGMIVHMVAYVVIVMMIPFYTSSSWYKALFSVVVHISTSGFLFGIFSQINHLSELCLEADGTTRKESQRSDMLKNSWAASQVETSNNFAPDSHVWHILSNGLNLQIEHHLFPSLNHSHLSRIAPVVKQTCSEYGVNYKCFESWSDVMQSTLKWLDQLAPDSDETTTKAS